MFHRQACGHACIGSDGRMSTMAIPRGHGGSRNEQKTNKVVYNFHGSGALVRPRSISCQSLKEAAAPAMSGSVGAMGQPVPPSPQPTRRAREAGSMPTPAAKRPESIESVMAASREFGQVMQPDELNQFVRTLCYDVNAMKH